MSDKKGDYKRNIVSVILAFIAGIVVSFFMFSSMQTHLRKTERNAYKAVYEVLTLKLKEDDSYKQFCSENGLKGIQQNWPSEANGFHLVIDDQLFGSYEGKVFFDTGEVYSILTTRRFDEQDKLDSFEKLKWPDKKDGDVYWR